MTPAERIAAALYEHQGWKHNGAPDDECDCCSVVVLNALMGDAADLHLRRLPDGTIESYELEQVTWNKYGRQLGTLDNLLAPDRDHELWRDVPAELEQPPGHPWWWE